MAFNDYRNNDLAKYRSTFANYLAEDIIGKEDKIAPDNFYDMGNVSGTISLDISKYNYFKMAISGDITISGTHSLRPKRLNNFYIEILNLSSYSVGWDSWLEWSSNTLPNCIGSGTHILSFIETNTIAAGTLSYTKCMGYLG